MTLVFYNTPLGRINNRIAPSQILSFHCRLTFTSKDTARKRLFNWQMIYFLTEDDMNDRNIFNIPISIHSRFDVINISIHFVEAQDPSRDVNVRGALTYIKFQFYTIKGLCHQRVRLSVYCS